MNLRKFLIRATIFITIISSVLISAGVKNKKTADSETSTVGYKYTICEYNGKVAVFSYGNSEPETVLDCMLNCLPESEIENIRNGIHVSDDLQLQQLIEAFD
ncbi:MAG: hypothetical protein IJ261_03215 [Clostridia bacterium]|nr:hypothetical protein [Clostridia bacterium]